MIALSFCIPVYNFGRYISDTLDSIVSEVEGMSGVEVVILDGNSTDNTEEIVRKYCDNFPFIRYLHREERGGIDADLNHAIFEAAGEYCWLMSGDDVVRNGSVKRLFQWIKYKHDVYICEHSQCDLDLRHIYDYPIFKRRNSFQCDFGNSIERRDYLACALNTEAIFSFMSGLVIKRSVWIDASDPEPFMHSCWGHVARLISCASTSLVVCFTGECWVDRRGDNDSFLSKGLVKRLGIAVDGYSRIAEYYYGLNSPEASEFRRLVRGDLRFILFMHAKCLAKDHPMTEDLDDLNRMVRAIYLDKKLYCLVAKLIYFYTPVNFYKSLRYIVRRLRKLLNSPIFTK